MVVAAVAGPLISEPVVLGAARVASARTAVSVVDGVGLAAARNPIRILRGGELMPRAAAWYKADWFRAYVPVIVALVSLLPLAAPTIRDFVLSLYYDVPFGQVAQAQEQNQMWLKNRDCVRRVRPSRFRVSGGNISLAVCPSGDILVEVSRPGQKAPIVRWIGNDTFVPPRTSLLFHELEASSLPGGEPEFETLCWWRVDDRVVIRIIRYVSSRQCFKISVNPYTGKRSEDPPVEVKCSICGGS